MATIQEVAQEAKVSVGTVSNYLNGQKVRQDNAKKIDAAVEKLGYHANYLAHCLRSNTTQSIGLLINNMQNHFATTICAQMEAVAEKEDYMMLVCGFRDDKDLYKHKLHDLLERQVDGLIIFEGRNSWDGKQYLDNIDIPVIAIGAPYQHPKVNSYITDDRSSTFKVVSNLIKNGANKIGVVAAPQHEYSAKERVQGVYTACIQNDFNDNNLFIEYGDYSRESGYKAARKLILENKVDTLFICNFNMEQGVLNALAELGITPGDDIRYACYDYTQTSTLIFNNITTICPNTIEIGESAASSLLQSIKDHETSQGLTITIPNIIS